MWKAKAVLRKFLKFKTEKLSPIWGTFFPDQSKYLRLEHCSAITAPT
jgi:hypothetical protein